MRAAASLLGAGLAALMTAGAQAADDPAAIVAMRAAVEVCLGSIGDPQGAAALLRPQGWRLTPGDDIECAATGFAFDGVAGGQSLSGCVAEDGGYFCRVAGRDMQVETARALTREALAARFPGGVGAAELYGACDAYTAQVPGGAVRIEVMNDGNDSSCTRPESAVVLVTAR